MRRRLKNFLPIVLIALLVQIFAPIAACWAAGIAASDPLARAVICRDSGGATADGQADPASPHVRDGCCAACLVLQTGAPVDVPPTAGIAIERASAPVVWHDFALASRDGHACSNAQARAPPAMS